MKNSIATLTSANLATFTSAEITDLAGSLAPNTLRAYQSHCEQFGNFAANAPLTDSLLADYCRMLENDGRAPATISQAVAAVKWFAGLTSETDPVGKRTKTALKRIRREHRNRGRGQSDPLTLDGFAMIAATARVPRVRGRGGKGLETEATAYQRGTVDLVISGLLLHAGLRRSEAAALTWADIADGQNGSLLVTVRTSKTNQDGSKSDIRLAKNGVAQAIRTLKQSTAPAPSDKVLNLSPNSINRRFKQAAAVAGIDGKLTSHAGRVGLASELTRLGSSTVGTMRAGGWKTARMVAHYSAGVTAENGAVSKFF